MSTAQTVERAIQILKSFSQTEPVLTVPILVQRLGLSRTIVVRLLRTLEVAGLVERVPQHNGYRIGRAAFELGALYLHANPFYAVATAALQQLADEIGFTVTLAILDGIEVVCLARLEGRYPVRFVWGVGDRISVTATAAGKAILMHFSDEQLDVLVGRGALPRVTEFSTGDRAELDRQLALARERGWTLAVDEVFVGGSGVGAAILDARGAPIAGITLSFLSHPPDTERISRLGTLVRQRAQEISRRVADYELYGNRVVPQEMVTSSWAANPRERGR